MIGSIRRLKIYRKISNTCATLLRIDHIDSKSVPQLRMEGAWLEKAGFIIGTNIKVTVRWKKLVIEVDD